MNKQLEELRAQRDLIQKHLEWINRQLSEAEEDSAITNKPNEAKPLVPETDLQQKSAEPTPSKAPEQIEIDDAHDLEKLSPPLNNDLFKAKVGCLTLFFLGIGIFLFLLFGLPYMID